MDLLLGLVIGFLLGAAAVYAFLSRSHASTQRELIELKAQREAERNAADEKVALMKEAQAQLEDRFRALSAEALSKNNTDFLNLAKTTLEKYQEGAKSDLEKRQEAINRTVEPVGKALERFNSRVDQIEERRTETDASLKEQLKVLAESQHKLSDTTASLVNALRKPEGRGRWGELQLRRTVELAGMINYCDFEEQASVEDDEGKRLRPDMVIRLPNERRVVVDSKVPLAAYLDTLEEKDVAIKANRLDAHARHIRDHIKGLSSKSYWKQFENAPEFVVLFLPNEAIFSAALEQDPQLIELGVENKVILATPTTLIALLKAIAYGWQQEAIAREAKNIAALGKELHERVVKVLTDWGKVGKSLEQSVGHYNTAMRSVESRLLVTGRKFSELKSVSTDELPEVKYVEKQPTVPSTDS